MTCVKKFSVKHWLASMEDKFMFFKDTQSLFVLEDPSFTSAFSSTMAVVFERTASFSGAKISSTSPDFTAKGDPSPYKSKVVETKNEKLLKNRKCMSSSGRRLLHLRCVYTCISSNQMQVFAKRLPQDCSQRFRHAGQGSLTLEDVH